MSEIKTPQAKPQVKYIFTDSFGIVHYTTYENIMKIIKEVK